MRTPLAYKVLDFGEELVLEYIDHVFEIRFDIDCISFAII